jgi:formylglycine-generating enzyme
MLPPPLEAAELPLNVLAIRVSTALPVVPLLLSMPPPKDPAELVLKVLALTERVALPPAPRFQKPPPPLVASLALSVLATIESLAFPDEPSLKMPPAGMALIPGGSFVMGNCMDYEVDRQLPLHTNLLSGFYMEQYKVTKLLWDEFYTWATNHGYAFDNPGSWQNRDLSKGTNHPVHIVNWYDVVKWCNARSEKEGLVPAYYTEAEHTNVYRMDTNDLRNAWVLWTAGYRLPTEAEWEKAARGGISGTRFPWGNTITHSQANYYADTNSFFYDVSPTQGYHPAFYNEVWIYTGPVGSFLPNGYGVYDMAGNVWEWCWDWYDATYYSWSPQMDPRGPSDPREWRVVRGGQWAVTANHAQCAHREGLWPIASDPYTGLRCVLGLSEEGGSEKVEIRKAEMGNET